MTDGAPPDPGRARRGRSRAVRTLKIAVAMASALVLVVTGYGWSAYRRLGANVATSDVLTPSPAPDGATDILLVGLDSRTDANGNPLSQQLLDELHAGPDEGTLNTDTLILIRIPGEPSRPTTAVSIPRDSYVAIPGYGTHKINSAYARAADAARTRLARQGVAGPALEQQAEQAGRRSVIATVEQLTGAPIDHYAEVNLAGFAEITQAVGGVPVCLNTAEHDPYSGADFPAGPQTVQGATALAFVRQRHGLPQGDLDRMVRQQAFLASLAHEILSAGVLADPVRLSRLITAITHYLVIDPGWDLHSFAAQVTGLAGGNIQFRTIPTGSLALRTPSDGIAVQVDPAAVHTFLNSMSEPTPDPATGTAPVAVGVGKAAIPTGPVAGVIGLLGHDGFAPARLRAGADPFRSTVMTAPGTRRAVRQTAGLPSGPHIRTDDPVPAGQMQTRLGGTDNGPSWPAVPTTDTGATNPSAAGDDHAPLPAITAAGVPCVN